MHNLPLALAALTIFAGVADATQESEDASATVKGPLAKATIRRVVQQHLGDVKQCYEAELARNQRLAGRVMVSFIIAPSGQVTDSRITQSTLGSASAEKCIAEAVRGWAFPPPEGRQVAVSYPFVLAPSPPGPEIHGALE